jgi:alkylation response protein AidB-like acyl-CoA dehydrogenase
MTRDLAHAITELFNGDMPDDANWLGLLIGNGLDQLPRPGAGQTLDRWRALAAVGEFDLSLTKLYEGHTDALAILAELQPGEAAVAPGAWCVWAAEAPHGRTLLAPQADGSVLLHGAKFWCSGAASADHALLTAWGDDGTGPQLVRLALDQPGIAVDIDRWKAVGMASSASVNVAFSGARAWRVGGVGDYLGRPGFWQGGAGIAACWFGGATGIARALRRSMENAAAGPSAPGAFQWAALGKVELALQETAATLRKAAAWIDSHPAQDASGIALLARLSAEQCVRTVLDETGRAMGATPFCLDEKFAKAAADLPVFVRQSHAERDFAALGERTLAAADDWRL